MDVFLLSILMSVVKGLPLSISGYNTLVLSGITTSGETFTSSDQIKVVKKIPEK